MLINRRRFRTARGPQGPPFPARTSRGRTPHDLGTPDAADARMHAAMYGLKRAYWGSLGTTRKRLKEMGLTAARFDLLYVLRQNHGPLRQRSLTRTLGVTHPVVSRMLKSLGILGLTKRERRRGDRRQWMVSLTPSGRALINQASFEFIFRRRAALIVEEGLCPNMPRDDNRATEAMFRMNHLDMLLNDLRYAFRAGGTLYYRWSPDDRL
jgi:DNA-binding MarR family transcriptional regulator